MPKILGTDFSALGLRLTLAAAMLGVGGLLGVAVAASCLLGATDRTHPARNLLLAGRMAEAPSPCDGVWWQPQSQGLSSSTPVG